MFWLFLILPLVAGVLVYMERTFLCICIGALIMLIGSSLWCIDSVSEFGCFLTTAGFSFLFIPMLYADTLMDCGERDIR